MEKGKRERWMVCLDSGWDEIERGKEMQSKKSRKEEITNDFASSRFRFLFTAIPRKVMNEREIF